MKSANQPGRDQRGLAIHEIGTILPGQVLELNTAWSYHRGASLDYLGNVDLMLGEVPHLQALYDGGFQDVCTPFVSANEPEARPGLTVWPNPVAGQLYLKWPETGSGVVRVFSQTGALLTEQIFDNTNTMRLETRKWPSGICWVEVATRDRVIAQRVLVSR